MATYNKRGYKAPKPKDEATDSEFDQYGKADAGNSATAEVFNSLDKSANRVEGWVARNSKAIFGVVGAVALITLGYVGYDKFVVEPKNDEAAEQLTQAQSYYVEALSNPGEKDKNFDLTLNGGEGKLGALGIIENHKGTDAANLAEYYAGIAYLQQGKFQDAINHLNNFKSKDALINALAIGAIGDAFSELGQKEDALDYYKKAVAASNNDLTSPRFLNKAGIVALELGQKEEALKMFTEIKNNYLGSPESMMVDAMIGMAQ
ncbi:MULTISPECIES: tetratricopeptide repeat protein [Myroides]|uniref:Tetratricopeptide repeat protein n=1 Tax=Myroides albus TaxID=2562892 RepID=A0A6I3LHI1_9FLAO|nr:MULTISPECIES: tetratricopeptide repeat protein [Myroides]MTG99029.1 tetratricopeptide repeat protein [Myroides albus]MVX34489.1 tetratricopeptide repeat protein [Myroides sp. LoEW2-1]UVD80438.1 tetratricopeptide repeat protein [Myroides albus]